MARCVPMLKAAESAKLQQFDNGAASIPIAGPSTSTSTSTSPAPKWGGGFRAGGSRRVEAQEENKGETTVRIDGDDVAMLRNRRRNVVSARHPVRVPGGAMSASTAPVTPRHRPNKRKRQQGDMTHAATRASQPRMVVRRVAARHYASSRAAVRAGAGASAAAPTSTSTTTTMTHFAGAGAGAGVVVVTHSNNPQKQPRASHAVLRTRCRPRPILRLNTNAVATTEAVTSAVTPGATMTTPSTMSSTSASTMHHTPGVSPTTPQASAGLAAGDGCAAVVAKKKAAGTQRVRFAASVKTWDGVRFERGVFDEVVTSYFEGKTCHCRALLARIRAYHPHVMPQLVTMCHDLADRVATRSSAPVLPHGGGSVARLGSEHLVPLLMLQGMIADVAVQPATLVAPSRHTVTAGVASPLSDEDSDDVLMRMTLVDDIDVDLSVLDDDDVSAFGLDTSTFAVDLLLAGTPI